MKKSFTAFILAITIMLTYCVPGYGAEAPAQGTTEISDEENSEAAEEPAPEEEAQAEDHNLSKDQDAGSPAQPEDAVSQEEEPAQPEDAASQEEAPAQPEDTASQEEEPAQPEDTVSQEEERAQPEDDASREEIPAQPEEDISREATAATAETAQQAAETDLPEAEEVADGLEIEDTAEETESYQPGEDMPADDLFAAYVNEEFGISSSGAGSTPKLKARRVPAGSRLSGAGKAIFDYISAELPRIAAGERTSTIFEIRANELGLPVDEQGNLKRWTAEELGVEKIVEKKVVNGVEQEALTKEAKDALKADIGYNFSKILDALLADHPYLLYWYYKTEDSTAEFFSFTRKKTGGVWTISITGKATFKLPVLPAYAAGDYEVDPSTGQAVQAAVSNAAEIVEGYSGREDLDILAGYRSEICALTSYNREAAATVAADGEKTVYGDPWQLIWVFDGDPATAVVCEGYAKAFKYLCDRTDFAAEIDCRTVTGEMNGIGHMWNIVGMDDDANYLVDVTNCDTNTMGADDKLFLVGTKGSPKEGYTFTLDTGKTISYIYEDDMLALWGEEPLTLRPHAYGQCEFGDWVRAEEPTCTGEGLDEKVCAICGERITEAVPAKGHEWETDYKTDREPTYTAEGSRSIHCAVCGESREGSQVPIARLKKPVSMLTIAGIEAGTYSGKAQTPPIVIRDGDVTLTQGTDYTVSYENNVNAGENTAIARITGRGNYTGAVQKTFTIRKAANTIKAGNIVKKYSAKARSFSLGAQIANGTPLYRSNSKSVTVNAKGVVTIKAGYIGKASITITAREYNNYSKTTKTVTVLVKPVTTVLTSTAARSAGKMTVKWRKRKTATGYQIQYSTSRDFTRAKSAWVRKNTVLTKTISGLTKGKKYYVRVRTYRKIKGVKYYSVWSNVKTVKIK